MAMAWALTTTSSGPGDVYGASSTLNCSVGALIQEAAFEGILFQRMDCPEYHRRCVGFAKRQVNGFQDGASIQDIYFEHSAVAS